MKSDEDTALATVQVPGGHCLLNEKWRGTALAHQINQVSKVGRLGPCSPDQPGVLSGTSRHFLSLDPPGTLSK
jgi:hypothetical protein